MCAQESCVLYNLNLLHSIYFYNISCKIDIHIFHPKINLICINIGLQYCTNTFVKTKPTKGLGQLLFTQISPLLPCNCSGFIGLLIILHNFFIFLREIVLPSRSSWFLFRSQLSCNNNIFIQLLRFQFNKFPFAQLTDDILSHQLYIFLKKFLSSPSGISQMYGETYYPSQLLQAA